jgi:uridine kinase
MMGDAYCMPDGPTGVPRGTRHAPRIGKTSMPPGRTRAEIVPPLVDTVTSLRVDHQTRVAIDGRSAAGKTTLADEFAEPVRARGRDVVRTSIDDFHRPGHRHRSRRGDRTPRTYHDEGYDYDAFRDLVLRPIGSGGSRRCRLALFDSFHDEWFPEEWRLVDDEAIALVDGAFLLRPQLAGYWDYVIWLNIDVETMLARACERDVAWVGLVEVVEERYRRHWIPTHVLYERLVNPQAHAHAVVDNRRPEDPRLLRLSAP